MKGRNSVVVGIRVSDEVYGLLVEEAGEKTVSAFIKEIVEKHVQCVNQVVNTSEDECGGWEPEEVEVKKVQPEVAIQCEQPSIAQEPIPYYKKGMSYKAGSEVIYKGRVMEVPELDLDGNTIWE